jgi:hypothetical protein
MPEGNSARMKMVMRMVHHLSMMKLGKMLIEEDMAIGEKQHRQWHQLHSCIHGTDHPPVIVCRCNRTDILFQDHVECELVGDCQRTLACRGKCTLWIGENLSPCPQCSQCNIPASSVLNMANKSIYTNHCNRYSSNRVHLVTSTWQQMQVAYASEVCQIWSWCCMRDNSPCVASCSILMSEFKLCNRTYFEKWPRQC